MSHSLDLLCEYTEYQEDVFTGHFLTVRRDVVRLPNGRSATREYIRHPGAVVVLALTDDGRIVLERQYRHPLQKIFIELPAGKIDRDETSLVAAQRELLEETGYRASSWLYLCTLHNAIAYSDEHLDVYLARGLQRGVACLDEGEFLEVFEAPWREALTWVMSGQITDVKTMIGLFWLEKFLLTQQDSSAVVDQER